MRHWYEKDHFPSIKKESDAIARRFSWITANWISVFRIALTLPTWLLFANGRLAWGAVLYGLNALFDGLDGAVARQQQDKLGGPAAAIAFEDERKLSYWRRLNLPGMTHFGKFMDPLADKFMNLGALLPLGWNVFPPWMLVMSAAFAFGLTVSRPLLQRLFGHDGSANKFGKFKMWTEIAAIAALAFAAGGIGEKTVAYVLLLVTVGLGIAGLAFMAAARSAPLILRASVAVALGQAVMYAIMPARIIAFCLFMPSLALAALSLLFQWRSAVSHWRADRRKSKTPAG